jgi:hypothetical protein
MKAVDAAEKYYNKIQALQERQAKLKQATDFVEWQEIKEEVGKKLPELTQKDFDAVGNYIDQQAVKDPAYYNGLQDKAGKLQKGIHALETLGILKRLKETTQPTSEPKPEPSAPDARAGSKKVKQTTAGAKTYNPDVDIDSLSKEELNAFLDIELKNMLRG